MNIGGLTIEMAADLARLRQDMDSAKAMVGSAMGNIQQTVDLAKKALTALGIGFGISQIVGWVKGAIDAADAASKIAQTAGVATKDVAGLKLAFELGGSSSEGMAKSMSKLQKEIVEGNKAFDQLGVKTRNTDGTLRGSKDVLYDVADAISKTEDKTLKAALAQEIFGKSGADLLPLLNGGSEGFKDMAETAAALGLVVDEKTGKAAEEFNDTLDLLHRASGGVATQVMAKMLPALNAAAGGFLDMVKEGQLVDRMANGLVVAFKLLYTGVLGAIEVFSTLGKLLGGTIARLMAEMSGLGEAVVKVFQGDFKGAAEAAQNGFQQSAAISREMSTDIRQGWQQTGSAIGKVWDETQSTTVKAMAEVERATKGATVRTKEQEEAAKAAAAEAKKQAEELKKLEKAATDYTRSAESKLAAMQDELDLGRPLTEGEKLYRKAVEDSTAGKAVYTEEQLKAIKATGEKIDAVKEEIEWQRQSKKENDAAIEDAAKFVESTLAETEKLREKNATLLLTREELAAKHVQELLSLADSKEAQANLLSEAGLQTDKIRLLREGAQALRDQAAELKSGEALEAIKAQRDEWQKNIDQINNGLTDALMRAFESGKGFADAFKDTLINAFKTMVLRPTIQAILQPVGNAMGSMFGMGGGGSAGGGVGGFGNLLGSLGNGLQTVGGWFGEGSTVGGWMNGAGSWLSNGGGSILGQSFSVGSNLVGSVGWGNTGSIISTAWQNGAYGNALGMGAGVAASTLGGFMAGRGLGQMISGGYSAIGGSGNTAVNIGSAIGAIWGPLGSAIGGAIGGLVNRAFGRGPKETQESGLQGTIVSGDFSGQTYANWKQKGGWFRSDKTGTDYGAVPAEMAQALDQGATAVYSQVQAYAQALKLPGDSLKNVTYSLKVKLGQDEKENQKALSDAFVAYQEQLSGAFSSALAPFQKAGESLTDTLSRLAALQSFSEGLNQFGGIFSKVANLSVSAKEELLGFAGGIEAFVAKTKSFVDAYYTDAEKYGLQAKELRAALQSIGIDAGTLTSRADFRKLVEGTDISTTEGRKQLDQLLTLAQAFAPIGQYLEQQGGSLASLASQAPQTALVESILKDQEAQAAYAEKQQAALDGLQLTMQGVHEALKYGFKALQDIFGDRLSALEGAIAANGRIISDAILEAQP